MITCDVDMAGLNAKVLAVTQLTGKTLSTELPAEAGRIAVALTKYTQPFGLSLEAKRKGEAALERDYKRVYPTEESNLAAEVSSYARPKDRAAARLRFLTYLQTGNVGASEKMLRDMHVDIDYSPRADPKYHQARWKNGKLYRGRNQAVLKVGSLTRLIAAAKRKVGLAKGGWATCAGQLGQKGLPVWITRHHTGGQAIVDIRNPMNVSVTLVNSVRYTSRVLSQQAKNMAIREREGMIAARIDMILKARLAKAGATK